MRDFAWWPQNDRKEKEANELCYRHTHPSRNEAWKAHFSPFLPHSFSLSLYQLDVKQWRWCEMNSPIQISIIYARPINNWLATSWKKRKHARKQSAFLSVSLFSEGWARSSFRREWLNINRKSNCATATKRCRTANGKRGKIKSHLWRKRQER